ncbi:aquaporin-like protein [Aspergillus cavernicola]|uniref:Aquaporin-like protein n=1 Tax=Aspergillus cavernicola TaxID=176166 RepID=A0ABR4IRX0_9EURO
MRSLLPHATFWRSDRSRLPAPSDVVPFAGRIGANQEFSLDKGNCTQIELLQSFPDAAPCIPLRDSLSPRHFLQVELWKAAVIEAIGSCLLVYLTCFVAVGLGQLVHTFESGAFIPSLLGGLTALLALPLFIFATGPISGAHLNPTITIATFFARLSTLPRCILYVSFQTFGGAIAGLLLRSSFDSRSFIVPGCSIDPTHTPLHSAFTIEFTTDFALIFLSFGVGLDPRQRSVFGPALGPILVGFVLGICTFFTGFSRPGYTGFSGNPARCFGAMVGSRFSSYHWIHWVGPLTASVAHGVLYYLVPPYSTKTVESGET